MSRDKMFAALLPSADTTKRARGEWQVMAPVPEDAQEPAFRHPKQGEPSAVWAYRDKAGGLLGHVLRFDQDGTKEFLPLTFCRHSRTQKQAWRFKSWPAPRPLYGHDRLSQRPDAPVVLVEGEKAADAAGRLLSDHVAVASPGGANAAAKADWTHLKDRHVTIWPDRDAAGRRYAEHAAECLRDIATAVWIATPPDGPDDGWDAADAVADGWDIAKATALFANTELLKREVQTDAKIANRKQAAPPGGSRQAKRNRKHSGKKTPQNSRLIHLVEDSWLWHTPEQGAFASVPIKGHRENWPINSREFKKWLGRQYYRKYDDVPGSRPIENALWVFEAKATLDGPCHDVWLRVGEAAGRVYLDLCDDRWRTVEIGPDGWQVLDAPPIKFRRSRSMSALPEPKAGEPVDLLRNFVNVATDFDFRLVVAWLIAALRPAGPYPLLVLSGIQGSSKSTVTQFLRQLIDPSIAPIRSMPKDERDLMITANNSWVLAYDNVSGLANWLSDAMCRLSTGGAFSTRQLHTDKSEIVMTA